MEQRPQSAFDAIALSLEKLGLEKVNLYLIHWPVPSRDLFVESWLALEEMRERGLTTSIGVSNFRVQDLERVVAESSSVPAVNQIELHPAFIQAELRAADERLGIATESWGPLGHARIDLMGEGPITAAAAAHGVAPAQVILRWHIQHGLIAIPKSNSRERMAQNFDVFGFELSQAEMDAIDGMDTGERVGGDPNG